VLTENDAKKVVVNKGKAKEMETDKGFIETDIVISNADYHFTEMNLLDNENRSFNEKYWSRKIMGQSAFLLYLEIEGRVDSLLHHNLYLDSDWKEHFDTIFKNPSMPDNPSYYISATSKTDDSAPLGCENVFVLLPVASGIEDNDKIRHDYADEILNHMSKITGYDY